MIVAFGGLSISLSLVASAEIDPIAINPIDIILCFNLTKTDQIKMNDSTRDLQLRISKFCEERDWDQFHTPKNLAMSICIEAAELLENFQWSNDHDQLGEDSKQKISDEVADVLIYTIRPVSYTHLTLPTILVV